MVGATPEQAMQFQLALGPAENAPRTELARHHRDGNVVMQSSSWTITARKPPA